MTTVNRHPRSRDGKSNVPRKEQQSRRPVCDDLYVLGFSWQLWQVASSNARIRTAKDKGGGKWWAGGLACLIGMRSDRHTQNARSIFTSRSSDLNVISIFCICLAKACTS